MFKLLKKFFTQRSYIEVDLGDQTLETFLFSFEEEPRWFNQGIHLRKIVTPNTAWFKHDAADKSPEINCRVHYNKTTKKIILKSTQEASFYTHYRLLTALLIFGASAYMVQDEFDINIILVFVGLPIAWRIIHAVMLVAEIKSFNSELKRELSIRINHYRGSF